MHYIINVRNAIAAIGVLGIVPMASAGFIGLSADMVGSQHGAGGSGAARSA